MSQYFERPKVVRGSSAGAKSPSAAAGAAVPNGTWNVTTPSAGLTKSSYVFIHFAYTVYVTDWISSDIFDGTESSMAAPHRPHNIRNITIPSSNTSTLSTSSSLPNPSAVQDLVTPPATPTFISPTSPVVSPIVAPPSPQLTAVSPPTSPILSASGGTPLSLTNSKDNVSAPPTPSSTPSPLSFASAIASTITTTTSNIANFARKGGSSPSSSTISSSGSISSASFAPDLFYVKETVRSLAVSFYNCGVCLYTLDKPKESCSTYTHATSREHSPYYLQPSGRSMTTSQH